MKLVLGAAMWQQPHILVLDEPTNYLDRESLGAMAAALNVRPRRAASPGRCCPVLAVGAWVPRAAGSVPAAAGRRAGSCPAHARSLTRPRARRLPPPTPPNSRRSTAAAW